MRSIYNPSGLPVTWVVGRGDEPTESEREQNSRAVDGIIASYDPDPT